MKNWLVCTTKAEEGLLTSDFRFPTSDFPLKLLTSDFRLDSSGRLDCRSISHAGINAQGQGSVERTAVPF